MPPLHFRPTFIPPDAKELIRGVSIWVVPGLRVWNPFVTADPIKDSEDWWEQQREGTPANDFAREYAEDFSVFAGKPVYPDYQDRFHYWPATRGPLKYVTTRPIIRGWDIPGPLACVWMQLVPMPRAGAHGLDDPPVRLHVLQELMADTTTEEFGRQVLSISAQQFPQATEYLDWADPAAWAKQQNDKTSCKDELRRKCGIRLQQGPTTRADRQHPVEWWLAGLMPSAPHDDPPGKMLLDWSCVRLREALKSGYHYAEMDRGSGRYHDLPAKNPWSHVAEAFEYGVARISTSAPTVKPTEPLTFTHTLGQLPP